MNSCHLDSSVISSKAINQAKDGRPRFGGPFVNSALMLEDAIKSGAPLVAVHRIPLFREFSRSSLHRLVRTGKLPALRVGRSYYSTPDVAIAALKENSAIPPVADSSHEKAVQNLVKKGIGSKGFPGIETPEKAMVRASRMEKRNALKGGA